MRRSDICIFLHSLDSLSRDLREGIEDAEQYLASALRLPLPPHTGLNRATFIPNPPPSPEKTPSSAHPTTTPA